MKDLSKNIMGLFTDSYGEIRLSRVITLAGALLIGGCNYACQKLNSYDYSEGTRVGIVNKASEKGLFWKTYEGEMVLEGLVSGNNSGANLWNFSIDGQERHGEDKEKLYEQLKQTIDNQQKVKIKYVQVLGDATLGFQWPWRGSTPYFIQSIEPISK